MNANSVTASGSTNGAIRIPTVVSIWSRIWMVKVSQNSCTPLGTPDEVTFQRRKKASAITITPAIAVAVTVSTLTGRPNHDRVSC
jgi:hypothetical protein